MPPIKDQSSEIITYKTNYILSFISIVFSIVTFYVIAKIIRITSPQNTEALRETFKGNFIFTDRYFAPEPLERLLFNIGIVLMPLLLIFYTLTLKLLFSNFNKTIIGYLYPLSAFLCTIFLVLLSYLGFSQSAGQGETTWSFYFYRGYFYRHFEFYSLLILPLIIYLFFRYYKNANKHNKTDRILNPALNIASLLLVAIIFLMNVFGVNKINNTWAYTQHLCSVFYPVTQVVAGKTLLVDFIGQYGLYPHFISPIFKLMNLTVLSFSLLMACLLALSYLCLYLFFSKTINNSVIRFLGFCTVVFWGYIFIKLDTMDYVFQYHPIRFLFPCLLIYLASRYFDRQNKILYYSCFILFSIAALWNADSGIIALAAWTMTLCYQEFFSKNMIDSLRYCLMHVLNGASVLFSVLAIYVLIMFLRSGHVPNLAQLFQYQTIYYYYGFFMLPMPPIHPWNIVILTYLIGLSYSIINVLSGKNNYRSCLVFLLSVLGVGLFSYYQGRSHNLNLAYSCYPAFILFTIFADDLFKNIRSFGLDTFGNHILFVLIMFFLFSSPVSLVTESCDIYKYIETGINSLISPPTEIARNVGFIRENTTPGEKIYILSGNQSVYYAETHTIDPLDLPGLSCLILKSDYYHLLNSLMSNNSYKVLYDLHLNDLPEYYLLNLSLSKLIGQYHYKIIDKSKDKNLFLLIKQEK